MSFLPGSWRAWINRSVAGPFLNADSLNDWEMKFRALDCLGAVRALGLVDALPGSPADGDAYLTSAAATPANKLVRSFGGVWESFTPPNGMVGWLPDGSAKQFLSGSWGDASFGGGGGAVSSVFGRTGAVTAEAGDYTPAQVGAAAAIHTHAAGDVTSGTFAEARIPALPQSRITGLETALAGKSDAGHTHAYIPTSLKGAANGVAELGADGKVPSAQLPASTLPTDPVFNTVTTTGAAYIGTNLDVSGNAVVDGWASIAGSLQAADARFTNLSHALGGTTTQLPGADEFGNLVASGLSTTAGSAGDFLVRKYRLHIGPLGAADYGVSTGGGLFVSSVTEAISPILALGHGTEAVGVMADVRFAQVVAAGKTGVVPQLKAQTIVEAIGNGGTVGGYGARVTQRIRGDNANYLTDVLALESSLVTAKVPFRTDSACHHKTVIRTSSTTTAANNHIVIFEGMGDRKETLPAATGSERILVMKNRAGLSTWTLDASGSETIDGAATLVLTANQCVTLIDYASGQWAVIGKVG